MLLGCFLLAAKLWIPTLIFHKESFIIWSNFQLSESFGEFIAYRQLTDLITRSYFLKGFMIDKIKRKLIYFVKLFHCFMKKYRFYSLESLFECAVFISKKLKIYRGLVRLSIWARGSTSSPMSPKLTTFLQIVQ